MIKYESPKIIKNYDYYILSNGKKSMSWKEAKIDIEKENDNKNCCWAKRKNKNIKEIK